MIFQAVDFIYTTDILSKNSQSELFEKSTIFCLLDSCCAVEMRLELVIFYKIFEEEGRLSINNNFDRNEYDCYCGVMYSRILKQTFSCSLAATSLLIHCFLTAPSCSSLLLTAFRCSPLLPPASLDAPSHARLERAFLPPKI